MSKVKKEHHTYRAHDSLPHPSIARQEEALAGCDAPAELTLEVGAEVKLLLDIDGTLVKGPTGRILKFIDPLRASFPTAPDSGIEERDGGTQVAGDDASGRRIFPLAAFEVCGGHTRELLVVYEVFTVTTSSGESCVFRTQLPLALR